LLERGLAHLRGRAYDLAIADCTAALEAVRDDAGARATAFLRRGAACAGAGDHERAVADYTESLRLAESSPAYFARGVAHLVRGELDRAVADLSAAIRLDANCAAAYRHRARIYFIRGEYDRAEADAQQALRLEPRSAHALESCWVRQEAVRGPNDRAPAGV
jgi:tetratricopeptide (TPR) repeat protein